VEAEKKAESPSVQRDALGRGEEWWRARVREWNEKFISAQRNYENTYSEWKAMEKELEASKFKPDSLKRKLKAEMKALEEKTKDWEKQVEQAKNMLENILPKEAQDYRANPEWLKPEERR
jgi:seryl-tRNA synthetase